MDTTLGKPAAGVVLTFSRMVSNHDYMRMWKMRMLVGMRVRVLRVLGFSPSVGWSAISLAIRMGKMVGIKMLRVLGFLYSIYEDGKDVVGEVLE